jgi:hypothetical protein
MVTKRNFRFWETSPDREDRVPSGWISSGAAGETTPQGHFALAQRLGFLISTQFADRAAPPSDLAIDVNPCR